eukprot:5610717-Pleurochrysis_carterae.AAC.3
MLYKQSDMGSDRELQRAHGWTVCVFVGMSTPHVLICPCAIRCSSHHAVAGFCAQKRCSKAAQTEQGKRKID